VSLFWDRAQAAAAETDPTDLDRDTVATLCERLDGIPLALELAASCMGAMTPQALLRRLDERFLLLVGGRRANPRHRTLRAAIEWSEELLAPTERRVFHRLGVFVGGFDLAAAEAVAADDELPREQVTPVLRRLVERSMVMLDREAGQERYRLLDTLRDFAVERLVAERDAERTRSAHAEHFAEQARESVAGQGGGRVDDAEAVRAARRSLGLDLGNYRAAMEYTRSIRSPLLATLAIHLNPLWYGVTGPREGRHWLEAALSVVPPEDRRARMGLAQSLSAVSVASGDLAAARSYRREFVVLVEGSVDPHEQWAGLLTLAQLEASEDTRSALAAADRALEVARSLDDPEVLVQSLLLGSVLRRCDGVELDRAQALEDEAAAAVERVEDQVTRSVLERMMKEQLVESQVAGGDSEAGLRFYRGLLSAEAEVLEPDWYDYPYLGNMARVAALLVRTGRPARGVRLAGAIDQACNQRGFGVAGVWGDDREVVDDAIRAMGARGRALYEGGRKIPIAEAKAYAIEDAPDDLLAAVRLTPREREVADFVRQGLTDGEIAASLVLSVRTVEGHVENLRGKLGVNTRAGVAAWAAVNLP
jgi:predicted ATPase/DNA-binding CsgD family transcriptional regulator